MLHTDWKGVVWVCRKKGSRVATAQHVAERFMDGEGMNEIAVDYSVKREVIEDAIRVALKSKNGGER